MGRSGGARLRDLFRRLGAWRRAGDWDAGLDEEMGFHLAKREERLREAGMAADEARGAARRAFGNPLRLREEARGAWLRPGVEALIQDLSLAARRMRRSPGYTLAGAGTLALAIGVCTAVFTLAHAVLLRPLPFADPDRLVRIYEDLTLRGFPRGDTSPANFRQLQQEARSFSGLTMWHRTGATLTGEGEPERIDGIRAAANFFDVFGVRPRLGRGFRAGDDAPGAPPTVVLSHSLWKRRYGGDWSLIGRTVSIGERPHTVLGAMPENFAYPSPEVQIWLPADLDAEDWSKRGVRYFLMAGRLREGVDIRGAQADLDALAPRFRSAAPDANRDFRAVVVPVREDMAGPARDRLLLLSAAVLLVLLIACANVAHLILSRSIRGAAELALRLSLGAGRGRLVRQLLTESLALAALGGAGGFALAAGSLRMLQFLIPPSMSGVAAVSPDSGMGVIAAGLAGAAALLSGLLPAWRTTAMNANEALRQGSPRLTGSRGQEGLRGLLVASEVAFAVLLAVGASLLTRTLLEVLRVHPGFDSKGVLTATTLPPAELLGFERRNEFLEEALRRVQALPGVTHAAYASAIPFTWKGGKLEFEALGQPRESAQGALIRQVTPGYFKALRIPLALGREFDTGDRAGAEPVAVVNRTLARRYLTGDPLTQRVRIHGPGFDETAFRVVGVCEDVLEMGLLAPAQPMIYLAPRQARADFNLPFALALRTTGDPESLVPALRATMREGWPAMPVSRVRTLESVWAAEMADRRPMALLGTGLAVVALLLASVGVYGLLAYSVAQRIPEFGVRVALGARAWDILASAIRRGALAAMAGIVCGLAASLVFARLMQGLLYGVKPLDPATFVLAPAAVLLLSVMACLAPARTALRIDPARALRSE